MPGLLKSWIDRVFAQGWAYDDLPESGTVKRLGRLAVQLVAIGAADPGTYARHDYSRAMRTQIDHGIFGYCGARVVGSELLLLTDAPARDEALRRAFAVGRELTVAVPRDSNASLRASRSNGENRIDASSVKVPQGRTF